MKKRLSERIEDHVDTLWGLLTDAYQNGWEAGQADGFKLGYEAANKAFYAPYNPPS